MLNIIIIFLIKGKKSIKFLVPLTIKNNIQKNLELLIK